MNKWLGLVTMFAPTILSLFGVNPVVGQLVVTGIITEEAARTGKTGADKKAAVIAGVQSGVQALNQSQVAAGKPPLADPATVATQVSGAIDLVVGTVNQIHGATPAAAPVVPAPALHG